MSIFNRWLICTLLLVSLLGSNVFAQPRVAVWDPIKGTGEQHFTLSPEHLTHVASVLKQAGMQVTRVTAEQLNDPVIFSAKKIDALLMDGGTIPKISIKSLQQFADQGGILVNLGNKVPFLIYIKQQADQTWTMDPPSPRFAWQTNDLNRYLGIKYYFDPKRHDQGVRHSITPLFERYMKVAVQLPESSLPSVWTVPNTENNETAEYFPLIRSQRVDAKDVIPQMFVSRFKGRVSIHCLSGNYTGLQKVNWWDAADQTVIAIANLAYDIKHHVIKLDEFVHPAIPQDMPFPKPLQSRFAAGSVQPSNGKVFATWGKFDGSSCELGKPVTTRLQSITDTLPQELGPGASVQIKLPADAIQATLLRYRAAYDANGAGLQISLNNHVLHNELFVYLDVSGQGNYSAPSYADLPVEIHRLVYLPADIWENVNTLTLHNPGREPLYFDAMQLESPQPVMRSWRMGLGVGLRHTIPNSNDAPSVPAKYSQSWSSTRSSARTQFAGPPEDPNRFDQLDKRYEALLKMNPHLELILEGTPKWAAIPNRYVEAVAAHRDSSAAADPQKYQQIVEHIITKFGDRIDAYELWNEADSQKYWRGSAEEYIDWCLATIATIRRLDPTAKIFSTGMAGFQSKFIHELVQGGVLQKVDVFAFHPYAGKSPIWDLPYGLAEGELMALGLKLPIYSNEMGFVWHNAEWFTVPPVITPQIQADMLNIAISRLLANDQTDISIFHSGGNNNPYSLIDDKGKPRPAYLVFEDYLNLCQRDGKRIELSLAPANETDAPLQGVYAAAAQHNDGSYTLIINPSMSNVYERYVRLVIPVASSVSKLQSDIADAKVTVHKTGDQSWAQIILPVTNRTVLTLKP